MSEDDQPGDNEEYLAEDEAETLMGLWDCVHCGATGIRGDVYSCADGCGAKRPDDIQFYLPENAEKITDEAGLAAAEAGPDWQCAFCEAWNPGVKRQCPGCGASLEDSERKQKEKLYDGEAVPRSSADAEALKDEALEERARQRIEQGMREGGISAGGSKGGAGKTIVLAVLGVIGLFVVGCCLLTALFSGPRERAGTVVGHRWQRSLKTEEYKTVSTGGWSAPQGAYEVSKESRVHHQEKVLVRTETRYRSEQYTVQQGTRSESYTERVKTGTKRVRSGYATKSLGNGRFKKIPKYKNVSVYKNVQRTRQVPNMVTRTRQVPEQVPIYREEPRYQDYYQYKIDTWTPGPLLREQGENREAVWPEFEASFDAASAPKLGMTRAGAKAAEYTILVRDEDGARHPLKVGEARWLSLREGDTVTLVLENGQVRGLKPPEKP